MNINGVIYILVGVFLGIFSYYISSTNMSIPIQKFTLFFMIGGVFILIGFFKIGKELIDKKKSETKTRTIEQPIMQQQQQYHAQATTRPNVGMHRQQNYHNQQASHHIPSNQTMPRTVKYCSRCGGTTRHFDKYCYKCGNRSFHTK